MKKYVCPDCGSNFEEGSVPPTCTNCGCPSDQFKLRGTGIEIESVATNASSLLESSNDFSAEKFGAVLANIGKVIGYIIMIGSFIAGIVYAANSHEGWIIFLIIFGGGLALGFLFLCMWAWLRLLVNISYRLTRIDNKTSHR